MVKMKMFVECNNSSCVSIGVDEMFVAWCGEGKQQARMIMA